MCALAISFHLRAGPGCQELLLSPLFGSVASRRSTETVHAAVVRMPLTGRVRPGGLYTAHPIRLLSYLLALRRSVLQRGEGAAVEGVPLQGRGELRAAVDINLQCRARGLLQTRGVES
jgi:hypothetical protein